VKIVHFADLHLDTPFRWAPPSVARRRRKGLRDALTRIADPVREESADALFCTGDLF
jgi:DNA repair protein SbcD/Mre11